MQRTKTGLVAAALALLLGLAAIGCGGDDDDDGGSANAGAATEASAPSEEPGSDVPSTGVEAAAPDDAAACLEEAGFTVNAESSIPDELREATGIEEQLTIATEDGGAGSLTYFATEEQALEANREESQNQSELGQSVIGRTGKALYVFASSDTEGKAQEIAGCL